MIEFRYRSFWRRRRSVKKPSATVTLRHGDKSLECHMLVDSGADITVLTRRLGEELGFQIEDGENLSDLGGIRGLIPCVYRTLEMQIGDKSFPIRVAWALVDNIPCLLGREDVFDEFHIEFRQNELKTRFTPIEELR